MGQNEGRALRAQAHKDKLERVTEMKASERRGTAELLREKRSVTELKTPQLPAAGC